MDKTTLLNKVEFVAFVTRQYHWLVTPLTSLYKKYFDVPITFFSDREFESEHKVIKVFPDECKLYHEPVGKLIKDELLKIDKPIIGMIFMDFLPQKEMNFYKLNELVDYMLENPVARANLWDGVEGQIKSQGEGFIVKLDKFNQHIGQIGSTSLMPALWNKEFLLEFIEDQWQLDNIELPGQKKFDIQNKWYSIGTVPSLLNIAHLCFTSDLELARTSCLKNEDKQFVGPFIPSNFKED